LAFAPQDQGTFMAGCPSCTNPTYIEVFLPWHHHNQSKWKYKSVKSTYEQANYAETITFANISIFNNSYKHNLHKW